jgi:subtilisin
VFAFIFHTFAVSTSHAQNLQDSSLGKVDVLIAFKQIPGPSEAALINAHGGKINRSFTLVPAVAATIPQKALDALSKNPNITTIEPDGLFYAINTELNNTWGVKHIGSGEVHDIGNLGAGVKVAVIDSGIDYSHSDLGGCLGTGCLVLGGYDFVNNDGDPMDDNGHGTHVAGTISALRNDVGVVGVAPEATLYGYKVLNASGSGSYSYVIAALEKALEDGVQITNNSYGSSGDPGSIVKAAFDNSAAAGILHIAAAGNNGNTAGKSDSVNYPARWDSVMAVAATNTSDNRTSWSSTGPAVEISAPGASINSTILNGNYGTMSGTSMASPHVAGVAALVMATGTTNASDVRQILNSTALDLGNPNHYGSGLINAPAAVSIPPTDPDPIDPPTEPDLGTLIIVDSVVYTLSGGKTNNRHLKVTVIVKDDQNLPVQNATISVLLRNNDTGQMWSATASTNSLGETNFSLNNAPAGCYELEVENLVAQGLTWDDETPANGICK